MSIPVTDKADNVSILIDNVNQITEHVNNQLDPSVLANLNTNIKNSLVNAINEINEKKIGSTGDVDFQGNISANSVRSSNFYIEPDEENNAVIYFRDAKTNKYAMLRWNSGEQKWQYIDAEGNVSDFGTGSGGGSIPIRWIDLQTVSELLEIVYLSEEKYNEMVSNDEVNENTIYMTESNSIQEIETIKENQTTMQQTIDSLTNEIELLKNKVTELENQISGVADTIDKINGEVI